MDSLEDHHYTFNRFFLSCIGLWPYEQTWFAYVKRVVYLMLVVSAIMAQISSLLLCDVLSTDFIFNAVTNLTFTVISLLKHVLYLWNLKGVKEVLEMIRENWKLVNDEYELRILLRHADNGKLMGIILAAGMISGYVLIVPAMQSAYNATSTEDDYMLRIKLTYTKNDHRYYWASLMHTYVVIVVGMMTLGGTESMTILYCHHGSGLAEILCHRVRNAFNDAAAPKKERAIIARVIDVARTHVRLLRLRKQVNESALMGYFLLLVLAVCSLSLNLLRLAHVMLRFRKLWHVLPTLAVIMGHFLYFGLGNHLGQMTIDHGAKFFSDTYTGMWYRASVPAQKLLLFVMCHSRKDTVVLFGGMFCPCYEGFTTMTKLSVSYLMVMYSLDL